MVGSMLPGSSPAKMRLRDARALFLSAQGLLDDPTAPATRRSVLSLVERLGFVQVDSINVVARAHHLTLAARMDRYRPTHLTPLLERDRSLFEHWTHDASMSSHALVRSLEVAFPA